MGYGWGHNYQIKVEAAGDDVLLTYGDGAQARFVRSEVGFTAPAGNFDILSQESDGTYRLLRKDQTRYIFDSLGGLRKLSTVMGTV
jgi:hypothetical protein